MSIPLKVVIRMAYAKALECCGNPILNEYRQLAAGKTGIEVYIITCNGKVSQEAYGSLSKAQHFIESRSDKPEKADEYTFIAGANRYEIHPVSVK